MRQGFYSFGRIKIISRTGVRSAVATAAYHSASKMTNEYDGVVHDYTKKEHVGDTFIRMPAASPVSWQDENISVTERLDLIWNHVEQEQTQANAQLARSNYIALPHSLTLEQALECVDKFIKVNCTSKGMGVTYSVHNQPGNCHVDMMYLMREYDKNGKAKTKSKKEYLCRDELGNDVYMDSETFKASKGYEKVYKYQKGGERKNMTVSEASELEGWERINKYPVCRTIKTSGWDDPNMAKEWRKSWEDILNEKFRELGIDERVDSRSYVEQGINKVAMVHEGWGKDKEEKKSLNVDIKQFNKELKEIEELTYQTIQSIEEQIDDLEVYDLTAEEIGKYEIDYNTNHMILNRIADSELFELDFKQRLKEKIKELSDTMKELFDYFKNEFKDMFKDNLIQNARDSKEKIHKSLDEKILNAASKQTKQINQQKNRSKGHER